MCKTTEWTADAGLVSVLMARLLGFEELYILGVGLILADTEQSFCQRYASDPCGTPSRKRFE